MPLPGSPGTGSAGADYEASGGALAPCENAGMRKTARPAFLTLTCLAAALSAAGSCKRQSSAPGSLPARTVPAIQYTPRPNPPTPTLRPGQPTRRPALPG